MEYTLESDALPVFMDNQYPGKKPYMIGRARHTLNSSRIRALHEHPSTEVGLCLCGTGECHIAGRIYRYYPGCIQITPPNVPHFACSDPDVESRWIWMYFDAVRLMQTSGLTDPDGILSLVREGFSLCGVFSENEYPVLTEAVRNLAASGETMDDKTDLAVALSLGSLLIQCTRIGGTEPYPPVPKIQPALDLIAEHLDDKTMLSEPYLASRCAMSVSGFRQLFRHYTNISPKKFIIRSRMAYAEFLLRESNLSIVEIAARTGYSDVSGFNRIFSSVFGTSPCRYRRGV